MIKICKGVYIHFLTVALFAVCFITAKLETFFITYLIMFMHELAHLAGAAALGLKPSHITLFPFGVNLKLKNNILCSVADEIILYGAGPLLNILLAGISRIFFSGFFWFEDFYWKNIILACLNLLPILPLDGGIILKNILAKSFGGKRSMLIMRTVSFLMLFAAGCGLYTSEVLRRNFSFYFFVIFLCGNLFTVKEKYNPDLLRELAFSNKSGKRRARVIVAKEGENMRELLKEFTNTQYNILCIIGENGEIKKIMSEREVIEGVLTNKYI